MASVTAWAYDFETGNLPPVCAISGRPAECWGKFAFRSTPDKAQVSATGVHVLGAALSVAAAGFVGAAIQDFAALRAKGHLPLTRAMRRFVRIARLTPGVALAAGLLVAVLGVIVQTGTLAAVGFAVFLLAVPVGALVNWRFEPHGSLRRINGTLVLKLTNVHPNFVAAEEKSLHQALEQGNWPPGFIGPALVPLRFRERLADIVGSIADGDIHGLVDAGYALDPNSLEIQLDEFGDRFIPLPPEAWDMAQCGKVARKPGTWWVVVPLWRVEGASDLWLEAVISEKDGELAFQIAITE